MLFRNHGKLVAIKYQVCVTHNSCRIATKKIRKPWGVSKAVSFPIESIDIVKSDHPNFVLNALNSEWPNLVRVDASN